MLKYIEIINDSGCSISYDTYAPDGEVEYIRKLASGYVSREILRYINNDNTGIIVIRIICGKDNDYEL